MNAPAPVLLKASSLFVPTEFQREWKEARSTCMADDWNPALAGILEVSKRGRKYAIFAGQHRYKAMLMIGQDDIWCLVHTGLTVEQEASLFWQQQEKQKKLSPLELHKAKLVAGDPPARELENIAAANGFTIGTRNAANNIAAVKAFESVYTRFGEAVTSNVLQVLAEWHSESSPNHLWIKGVGIFLATWEPIDFGNFRRRLDARTPGDIKRIADTLGGSTGSGDGMAFQYARAFAKVYNGGRHSGFARRKRHLQSVEQIAA